MINKETPKYGTGIQRRIVIFFSSIVFFTLFPVLLIDRLMLGSYYEKTQETLLKQSYNSLTELLETEKSFLEHLSRHYSSLDEILDLFSETGQAVSPGVLRQTIIDSYLEFIGVLDREGHIVFAQGDTQYFLQKDRQFDRRLFRLIENKGPSRGLWLTDDGHLWLMDITEIRRAGTRLGYLVLSSVVDKAMIEKFDSIVDAKIDFYNSLFLSDPKNHAGMTAEEKALLESSRKEMIYSQKSFLVQRERQEKGVGVFYLAGLLRGISGDDVGIIRIKSPVNKNGLFSTKIPLFVGIVLFMSSISIVLMSRYLTRHITAPLIRLRETIQGISSTKSLSQRIIFQSEDEVGGLIHEFNSMLDEIEKMNQKIKRASDEALILYKDLLDQKKFTSELLALAPTIVLVLLPDGRIKFVNEALEAVAGYKTEEVIGRNWLEDFLPFDSRQEVKAAFDDIVKGNIEPYRQRENRILTKKGGQRTILWSNSLLKDKEGHITAVISIGQDITEHKTVESELIKKMNELERFYKVTMDREKVILHLKDQIKDLKQGIEDGKKV